MRNLIFNRALGAALVFALAGCSTRAARQPVLAPPNAGLTATNAYAPQPYMRIAHPDTNIVQLQIAARRFVPAHRRGPVLWLVGTSHVGEPEYYHALQKLLDVQTVVLYEGVNADAHPRHVGKPGASPRDPPAPRPAGTNQNTSMQDVLATSLGLVFQLNAINYDRTNFVNSDLSILQLQRIMIGDPNAVPAAPGEKGRSNHSLDALLQIMDGSSFLGSIFKMGLQFIGANPQLQAITKLTFIETLGRLKGDFSGMRGLPPDMKELLKVLIESRNQNVIEDIKTELGVLPRNGTISVFYGTGHMDDMERRVVRDLNYRPAGDIWFTAFSVDVRKTGLSPGELESMRNMIQWQLNQMQQ
jgi:hypothetical protein